MGKGASLGEKRLCPKSGQIANKKKGGGKYSPSSVGLGHKNAHFAGGRKKEFQGRSGYEWCSELREPSGGTLSVNIWENKKESIFSKKSKNRQRGRQDKEKT